MKVLEVGRENQVSPWDQKVGDLDKAEASPRFSTHTFPEDRRVFSGPADPYWRESALKQLGERSLKENQKGVRR